MIESTGIKLRAFATRIQTWWAGQSTKKKIGIIAVIVVVLFALLRHGTTNTGAIIETVKRQNLERTVAASGTVVSSTDLSLGFEQSKMVSDIRVFVGDKVKKGQILATLSNGTEQASVTSARGALLAARARYNKVLEGSSNEEIALAKVQVENARRKLLSDGLVAKPESADYSDTTPIISGTYIGSEGQYRIELNVLGQNELEYSGIERGVTKASDTTLEPLGTKGLFIQFPSGSRTSFTQGSVWTIAIPNTETTTYTANKADLAEKEATLAIKQASARQPDVDAALADIVTAQAALDSAIANYEKTILRAPADGTVTVIDTKVGEISQVGKSVISLQDISNLYLEANVNESSIKNITVGQPVTVTFDAFGTDTYHATVSSIDPAATITDNVVNYKIKALLADTMNIRPGMTANMTILTAEAPNVLVIPDRVITTKDGKSTVDRLTADTSDKATPVEITTGLKGDGGLVEVQSGLVEGDRLVWTPPTSSK